MTGVIPRMWHDGRDKLDKDPWRRRSQCSLSPPANGTRDEVADWLAKPHMIAASGKGPKKGTFSIDGHFVFGQPISSRPSVTATWRLPVPSGLSTVSATDSPGFFLPDDPQNQAPVATVRCALILHLPSGGLLATRGEIW